ncbi:MAG: glutathione S-transferase N-terminal domain-containing protein [Candidatus Omnitrophica bacterium]|nr:glutathione S-transferase N-terminal domain-containing protein [Candidatus Omnitrophota bacterium]
MLVEIYSTQACPYCKMAKLYFSSKGISYADYDVSEDDEKAKEMVKVSGQMGVPVIVIDGELVIGFDKAKINSIIKNKI